MNDDHLRDILNQELAGFFGKLNKRLDTFDETKADRAQVEKLQTTLDGIAGQLSAADIEQAATDGQLKRHEGWIGQLADTTGTKLVPEQ